MRFNSKITVLNKLSARESGTKCDIWKKTVLTNCFFSAKTKTTVSANSILNGKIFICRVPKSKDYLPYHQWSILQKGFTFSGGDYIILGEVAEEITCDNIIEIARKYADNCMQIRAFQNNTSTNLMPHYKIEGV